MSAPLLEIDRLQVTFPVGGGLFRKPAQLQALAGVSATLAAGKTLGVVGESGCGKSTLGRAILGFAPVSGGTVRWKGRDITALSDVERAPLRREMQIIFQNPLASLNPRMTIGDSIAEPLEVFRPELSATQRNAMVAEWLARVGLFPDMAQRFPNEFSGGQAQRIAIARAMIAGPELLICDEAVSALDVSIKAQIINLLKTLQRDTGVALIFISHDLAVVRQISHDIVVMYLGRVMEAGGRDALFAKPLHPYTQALMAAAPVPDPRVERTREAIVLGDDLPSPLNPPSGCVFRTRCPIAKPNCIRLVPELTAHEGARVAACHFAGTLLV
jgi:oligopeptide transport system ATP-binding protein